MYTGRYPYVLANPGGGPEGQENSLRAGDVIYPEYLKASGYQTKHAGKNHVGAQKFMDARSMNSTRIGIVRCRS
jgi:arylsulfatase A-like enzyme